MWMRPPSGATCAYCKEPAICRFGNDKTPMCLEHFEIAMEGLGKIIKRLVELTT
jgi:hypothetical protein